MPEMDFWPDDIETCLELLVYYEVFEVLYQRQSYILQSYNGAWKNEALWPRNLESVSAILLQGKSWAGIGLPRLPVSV